MKKVTEGVHLISCPRNSAHCFFLVSLAFAAIAYNYKVPHILLLPANLKNLLGLKDSTIGKVLALHQIGLL